MGRRRVYEEAESSGAGMHDMGRHVGTMVMHLWESDTSDRQTGYLTLSLVDARREVDRLRCVCSTNSPCPRGSAHHLCS
jgi:hypothetical protein